MLRKILYISIFFLLKCLSHAQNKGKIPPEYEKILISKYGINKIGSWDQGKLDDSENDYLVLFSQKESTEADPDGTLVNSLYLFSLNKNKSITQVANANNICTEWDKYSCSISIGKKFIFIETFEHGGMCDYYYSSYQFKKKDNDFKLIGVDHKNQSCDDKYDSVTGKSINFLSHKMIIWHEHAAMNDQTIKHDGMFKLKNHVEKKFSFTESKIWTFEDFSLDKYNNWESIAAKLMPSFEFNPESASLFDLKERQD